MDLIILFIQKSLCVLCYNTWPHLAGMCLGCGLQAPNRPGARGKELPWLQRKRWLPSHHCDLSPPSTSCTSAQPDAALHRLSRQPRLPRPGTFGRHSQADCQLHWTKWEKLRVPFPAGQRCEDNSARGLRWSLVFSGSSSERETTK